MTPAALRERAVRLVFKQRRRSRERDATRPVGVVEGMRLVSNIAVLMICACSALQVVPLTRDFCRPQPVLLVGRVEATAQLATSVQQKLGPEYPLVFEPPEAEHLTVTVVEYDYRQFPKQELQSSSGVGGSVPIPFPQYRLKYEPEATVLIRVSSSKTVREYTGSVTGLQFLPSERPGISREELLDLASTNAVQQLANDMAACKK